MQILIPAAVMVLLGSLSKKDRDGYGNVGLKEWSRCFKLYRAYSFSYKYWRIFLELNSKGPYHSSGAEWN